MEKVKIGDTVVLVRGKKKHLISVTDEMVRIDERTINAGKLIGIEYGSVVPFPGGEAVVLRPSVMDMIESIKRKAQIIIPKDAAQIIFHCNIHSGDFVVEGGAGSGAMTLVLCHFVGPDGKVLSYEKRKEFAEIVRRNIERSGYSKYSEIVIDDVCNMDEKNVDAVVLDVPRPWDAVEVAYDALKKGGHLCSYSPTVNQVERTVRTMRGVGFAFIKTMEIIQREMIVGDMGVRPAFEMLGHTGYLTFGRKI